MQKNNLYIILVIISFSFTNHLKENIGALTFYNKSGTSIINVVESNINNTVLEILVDGYEFEEILNDKFLINIDKGVPSLEQGFPNLPRLNTSIIIPDQANMKVSILEVDYQEFDNMNVLPSKGNILRNVNPDTVPYLYGEIYKENSFYPSSLAELGDPYILRGLRGQGVIVNPVQFNPVTKTVRVYNRILININQSNQLSKNSKNTIDRREDNVRTTYEFNEIYKNLFINYQNDLRFDYLSDQGNMLVICYDDFMSEMQSFVSWKNKKGIPTEIVALTSVGNSALEIQEYINSYYYEHGLTYLLLVGDADQMPTHIVNGSASDPTYGFIEGDDAFSEIIVGRFSANNPSHVAIQVQKTIEYEQNPSSEVNHFNKALGIASNQGPGYGGLSDNDFSDLLWSDFLSNFTYESHQGVYDGSGSLSEGIDAINEGVGIINYTGHSGPTGWGNGAPLSVADVNALTNTDKLPFIFTVGCNPGQFNDYIECFCESWMWSTDDDGNPTGAVGHLGSTISQSWEPPMHGQWAMNSILTESYDNNVSRSYGGIAVNGCMHMNEAQGSSGINETTYWTLFGDPSLLIRTDIPQQLDVSYNQSIVVGQTEFVVDVGTDGALAALSIDGVLKSYAYSNGGVAILDLSGINTNPGEIDLVISSFNTYPHQSTIQVIATDGAYLVFDSYDLLDDSNDLVEYLEEVSINLNVENVGVNNTNAINISVESESPYITLIDNTSMIAYAISGALATTENPISFIVSESVPDGHLAHFEVLLSDGDDEWQVSFSIEIHAPVFEILNPILIDANDDGVWDAGETATIDVDLVNSGSAPFQFYPGAIISTDNEYVNIISGINDNTFYAIAPNTTYEGSFIVEALESTPLSTTVEFSISWGYSSTSPCDDNDCVEQAELLYSTIIGHPSILIWDPSTQHISGNRLVNYLNENNITAFDYIDNQNLDSIENYKTAFIFLGVYPENHVLQDSESSAFTELLGNNGNIYMEGADTWAFDVTTNLHSMFGLVGEADGSADLSTISGIYDTFTEGMSFSYDGGNSYVDRILPSGGFSILNNDSPEYTTAVAFDNTELGYRTIGASHDIGGLQGDDFENYVDSILEFFNDGSGSIDPECVAGDINGDGTIDVTDIIRQVNIILNTGVPASEDELCAADANGDGSINISDVIIIINIILDRNNNSRFRMTNIDQVEMIYGNRSLYLNNEGPIRGIEIVIYSDSDELNLNETLNMDIAYNKYDGKHHLLIYSLNGNVLHEGKYQLFSSNKKFEIDNLIVLNSNNDPVQINYINETQPEIHVLKQNYPNPFNPTTNIDIELLDSDNIKLIVYDINGRQVRQLANGYYSSGSYNFSWNSIDDAGRKVSSGVYIYQLITSYDILTKKMLLLK